MWNNFGRSAFETRVFPAIMLFFILSDNFFDSRPIFGSIGFPDPERYAKTFFKKNQENQNHLIRKKKNSCNMGGGGGTVEMLDYLKRKDFYNRPEKP